MTIAILTRSDFRSPRILAESLKFQLEEQGIQTEIFYEINILSRLVSLRNSKLSFHFWLKEILVNLFKDMKIIHKLKNFDAIVISEYIPYGFLKRSYNVEKLRRLVKKPIGFYEVYYLGNAPTKIDFLKRNNDALFERFDFHLSVGDVGEIKQPANNEWYPIGIKARTWNLRPSPKKELIAIIDFIYPGNEHIRDNQIRILKNAGIKYIALEGSYTFEEIRSIYQQGAIYFMHSFEAFGLPLLECLCCGCQVFTQESWWPMSWRLNENPEVHGEGVFPDCFTIYNNKDRLISELAAFKENYDLIETPKKVFDVFLEHYPQFYYGNEVELKRLVEDLENTVSHAG